MNIYKYIPPVEKFADGQNEHRAGDGVAHFLIQAGRPIDSLTSNQFRGQDAVSAQVRVHPWDVGMATENWVAQN